VTDGGEKNSKSGKVGGGTANEMTWRGAPLSGAC
jgi:hypothetical protein